MAGPLEGVRVLELPAIGPVPFIGMLLADMGAAVTRIDRLPGSADLSTGLPIGPSGPMGRGRRSVGLDLRRPGAAEVVLRLAAESDVLIEGFRPGVAERLGVGPTEALSRNPALLYGRMTGYGQDGPLAPRAGHDLNYLAVSGLLHGIGPADGPPTPPSNYIADFGGGAMVLAFGVVAALLSARTTGVGQVIDAAMTEGAAYLGTMTRIMLAHGMWSDSRACNLFDGGAPNYRCYECADGRYVAVAALEPQFWSALLATLKIAEIGSPWDQREWPAVAATLAEAFARKTRDEWDAIFASVDACVSPVLTLSEAPTYAHNAARGSYVSVADAAVAGPVPRFTDGPPVPDLCPADGAATLQTLTALGFSASQLDQLRADGAIL